MGVSGRDGDAVALKGKSPVFSVSGDGGFLMTAQELATATRYELSVIAIIHNDSTYRAVKNIQKRKPTVDFATSISITPISPHSPPPSASRAPRRRPISPS